MHIIHYFKNYYIILKGIHSVICWISKVTIPMEIAPISIVLFTYIWFTLKMHGF